MLFLISVARVQWRTVDWTPMQYHTAGGWISAFEKAMNDALTARSGTHTAHGPRFRAEVCTAHADCIWVRFDGQRHHVPWKERDPEDVVKSLLDTNP